MTPCVVPLLEAETVNSSQFIVRVLVDCYWLLDFEIHN